MEYDLNDGSDGDSRMTEWAIVHISGSQPVARRPKTASQARPQKVALGLLKNFKNTCAKLQNFPFWQSMPLDSF